MTGIESRGSAYDAVDARFRARSESRVGMASVRAQQGSPAPVLLPSPDLGPWLRDVGGSLCFSTYQSSRVFFLFADDQGRTVGQERVVGSAMGLAVDPQSLWISNKEQVWRFSNVGAMDVDGQSWQAVYMPRKGYFLGGCDTHDILPNMTFRGRGHELAFVNTNFSCVAAIDAHYGFRPLWKPDFITALSPEDRCHLNGLCARDGELAYVTLCGRSDQPMGWRAHKGDGGLVVDIRNDRVLCSGLSMPHSPRWYRDRLWVLNSGAGTFGYIDGTEDGGGEGRYVPLARCPGFARGLCFVDNYAIIGLSKLRQNSFANGVPLKGHLDAAGIQQRCGLIVIDLAAGRLAHWLTIEGPVTELYDVGFLPGITRPYTPGFSEPHLHRDIAHPVPGIFPVAPPRPVDNPDAAASAAPLPGVSDDRPASVAEVRAQGV